MNSPTIKDTHWLDVAETTAVLGSIVGSITGVVLNQFIWATIPLSATATLGLLNHQRLKKMIELQVLKEQTIISSMVAENQKQIITSTHNSKAEHQKTQGNIAELADDLKRMNNFATTELARLQKEGQDNLDSNVKDLNRVEDSLVKLDSLSSRLTEQLDKLEEKQKETSKLVRELKAIDIFTQNIKANLNTVQSYFERGLAYQRLGNKNRAIEDFTKTIELSSDHAKAYHNRGLIYLELNILQKAIMDLRKASQLYFDIGNLDKYREARDLSQQIHQQQEEESNLELTKKVESNGTNKVVVGNLFD